MTEPRTKIPPSVAEHALAECERLQARVAELEEALRACQRAACRGKSSAWKTALGDKIGAALAKGEK